MAFNMLVKEYHHIYGAHTFVLPFDTEDAARLASNEYDLRSSKVKIINSENGEVINISAERERAMLAKSEQMFNSFTDEEIIDLVESEKELGECAYPLYVYSRYGKLKPKPVKEAAAAAQNYASVSLYKYLLLVFLAALTICAYTAYYFSNL